MNTSKQGSNQDEQKDKVRHKYRTLNPSGLEVIPAKPKVDFFKDMSEKRVAVYARVSTGSVQQTSSYEMQQKYYSDFVARRPSWTLVDIYADEGKTGTSVKKRKEFLRMIDDCENGKIDIIVTKSVARFSRNILDGIGYVRKLASQRPPVGVYFENEGVYSLNSENEMSISFLTTIAEGESRARSTAMNSSIEMRFSNGLFLTPPLLGYDNDEDGKLIINEDEASTVRLIFYMYLSGHTTGEIAKALEDTGRRTKLGKTKWSTGSVLGVLKNERHCGDILSRKTWTPNFLDHKAIKNRENHHQYRDYDHHEAIISRDDFLAVQRMISNAKYGGNIYFPCLKVSTSGALSGFVSVNPRWGAFTPEDYIKASESAEANDGHQKFAVKAECHDFDLRGYQVVRTQFFSCANVNSMTFSPGSVRFSIGCIRKFCESEYIELLVHPAKGLFAVRPCDDSQKNAMRWAKMEDSNIFARAVSGMAFASTLYDLFGWHPTRKYRLRCELTQLCGEYIMLFDAHKPEIIISQDIIPSYSSDKSYLHELDDDAMYITSRSRRFVTALPIEWRDSFGEGYYCHSSRRLSDMPIDDTVSIYNNEPEINPTPYEALGDSVNRLFKDMRNRR